MATVHGPPPFTRGVRGWVLVFSPFYYLWFWVSLKGLYGRPRVRLQGLYGRVSFQGLSWGRGGDQIRCSGQSRGTVEGMISPLSAASFHYSQRPHVAFFAWKPFDRLDKALARAASWIEPLRTKSAITRASNILNEKLERVALPLLL